MPGSPRDTQHHEASLAAAVVANSLDGFAVMDRENRYVLWNPAMERFTGKTAAEVLGRDMFEMFPFLRELGLADATERALRGEVVATDGVEHVEDDGARKVYDRVYLPLRAADGEIAGVIAIVRDATSRYAAQDALRTTETKLFMAAEATGIGLWTWDPVADLITWEDTTCRVYGRSPGDVPKSRNEYLGLIHPDDRERTREHIARGKIEGHWDHEYRIIRPDGAVRWLTSRTRTVRTDRGELVLGAVFDVTERKEAEERQRAAQRLEIIGQLTAGIAHNFNNILTGMLPNLQLATRTAPQELLPLLRDAEQSTVRAAGVVRELMTYAGGNRTTSRRSVPLGRLVEQTVAFCRTTFDTRIDLELDCHDGVLADVDTSQLEQAILNLLINARDALENVDEPKITVACFRMSGAPELEGRAGEWAAIRVTDNGVGMDAPTIARMYEPFFTTKPVGNGTGLGLATTQTIVRHHGGFVSCRSALGQGTVFTLYVPGHHGVGAIAPQPIAIAAAPQAAPQAWSADATILVVDDDEQVRIATTRVLTSENFGVETATSGAEALEIVADPTRRIDLVLLDVAMPGMSGPQLRQRLRELAPTLPVVFVTGYMFEAQPGDSVLEKPVRAEALVTRIAQVLSANTDVGPRASDPRQAQ